MWECRWCQDPGGAGRRSAARVGLAAAAGADGFEFALLRAAPRSRHPPPIGGGPTGPSRSLGTAASPLVSLSEGGPASSLQRVHSSRSAQPDERQQKPHLRTTGRSWRRCDGPSGGGAGLSRALTGKHAVMRVVELACGNDCGVRCHGIAERVPGNDNGVSGHSVLSAWGGPCEVLGTSCGSIHQRYCCRHRMQLASLRLCGAAVCALKVGCCGTDLVATVRASIQPLTIRLQRYT